MNSEESPLETVDKIYYCQPLDKIIKGWLGVGVSWGGGGVRTVDKQKGRKSQIC